MAYMKWGDELSVGVPKLDEQHKFLVDMVNDLHVATYDKHYDMTNVIRELVRYTQTHFKLEEELMERYDYAELDLHRKQHQFFIKKILIFQKQYHKNSANLTENVMNFLTSWLANHIQKIDSRYIATFADKEI